MAGCPPTPAAALRLIRRPHLERLSLGRGDREGEAVAQRVHGRARQPDPAPRRLLLGGVLAGGGLAMQKVEEEVVGDDEPSPLVPLNSVRPLEEPTSSKSIIAEKSSSRI